MAASVPDEEKAPADPRGKPHTATAQTQAAAEAEAGRDPDADIAQADTGDEPGDDNDPSDSEDDPDPDKPRSSEGHGSQRVQNKASKYVWKQSDRATRQARPPPQGQTGPGWGIIYRDQIRQQNQQQSRSQSAGSEPTHRPSSSSATSRSQHTNRDNSNPDWADLLNRHTLPWGTYGAPRPDTSPPGTNRDQREGTTPDQQPAEQPTIQETWQLWTGETHPASSTQQTSDLDTAQPADDTAHTASTEAQPQATPDTATADNTILPWEAQLQDEWADEGTAVTAPPLTAGIVATFTAISDTHWVLEVTEDTAEDAQAADMQPLPPPPQPTQLEPTTLGDMSMEADSSADNPQQHATTAQAPQPQHQGSDTNPDPTHERSWQRVERHLEEIRRIISSHGGTTAEAIMRNADMALMHLLVDTPTAEELAATQDYNNPQAGGQAARIATAALQNIARQQMSLGGSCISYGQLEPHVAALMQWLSSLHAGNIAVRVQLPPILEPLRRVLNKILDGATTTEDWALLIAVAEAMDKLLTGDNLTHPANVLAVAAGSHDTNLVERPGGPTTWETAIIQMQEWAADLDAWPTAHLPQVQEAAMRLVRGISARVPEEKQGQPNTTGEWWRFERHHGMGDLALFHGWTPQSPSSPRSRGTRRPRSPSSDSSHRRRRALAEHMHNHT
ncbi:unnamed protein product [Symbiodinium sp. CCMP2592]|nr:unnamed protein product [Symbiodinium sp. CCMP2592]